MRSTWTRLLSAFILAPMLPALGSSAERPVRESSSAAIMLARDFFWASPAEPASPSEATDFPRPSPDPGSDKMGPVVPPKTSLDYELPGGIRASSQGRIEADSVWASQSPLNKATVGDLQNSTGFRRARFGAKLQISENVEWMSEFDFSNSQFRVTDVYVGLIRLPVLGEIRVGQFREPFSLEAQTSSNHIVFTERSQANSLVPGRNWGVAVFAATADRQGTFSIGAFRSGSDPSGTDSRDQNDWAYTTRATRLFWYDDAEEHYRLIHIGGAYSFRRPPDDTVIFSLQKGILEVGDSPLNPMLVSPVIQADRGHVFGVEMSAVCGPFSLQGEWVGTHIPQIVGGSVFYHGAYLYASVFLTGEHRAYDLRRGAFGEINVRRPFKVRGEQKRESKLGIGAWEMAWRYSFLNLDDPNAPPTVNGTRPGGKVGQFGFEVNWYLNNKARLMATFSPTRLFDPNTGTSTGESYGVRFAAFW